MHDMQYKIVIVTNQPGISLGYFTKEDLFDVNSKMLKGFSEAGILIQKIYFCPHSDAEKCDCRKPKPGMLKRAEVELAIDMENSFMIGDSVADILAGKDAGVKTISLSSILDAADYSALNWSAVVDWIKKQEDQCCTSSAKCKDTFSEFLRKESALH